MAKTSANVWWSAIETNDSLFDFSQTPTVTTSGSVSDCWDEIFCDGYCAPHESEVIQRLSEAWREMHSKGVNQ